MSCNFSYRFFVTSCVLYIFGLLWQRKTLLLLLLLLLCTDNLFTPRIWAESYINGWIIHKRPNRAKTAESYIVHNNILCWSQIKLLTMATLLYFSVWKAMMRTLLEGLSQQGEGRRIVQIKTKILNSVEIMGEALNIKTFFLGFRIMSKIWATENVIYD